MSDYRYEVCEHNGIPSLHVMIDGEEGETHIPLDDLQASLRHHEPKGRGNAFEETLTEGRAVHYVAYNGRHLAAIVIGIGLVTLMKPSVSNPGPTNVTLTGNLLGADLAVFTNMENVAGQKNFGLQFHQNVAYSESKEPGTWHWIKEDVDAGHVAQSK